jgi:hypothetical protein
VVRWAASAVREASAGLAVSAWLPVGADLPHALRAAPLDRPAAEQVGSQLGLVAWASVVRVPLRRLPVNESARTSVDVALGCLTRSDCSRNQTCDPKS